jgi:hypothetical protein
LVTTKLNKQLRREVTIRGEPWVVNLTPLGLRLTRKGRRKGVELLWQGLVSGDTALAVALNASVREVRSRRVPRLEKSAGARRRRNRRRPS